MYKVEKIDGKHYLIFTEEIGLYKGCEISRTLLSPSAMSAVSEAYNKLCFEEDLQNFDAAYQFSDEERDRIYRIYDKALSNDEGWVSCLEYAVSEVLKERGERDERKRRV